MNSIGSPDIGNLIFLSYRRADSAAQTLALRLELETRLRAVQVFVDTSAIQGGDIWPRQIEDALHYAKVFVPIIGKAWSGPPGNRRIDDPEDWVHKETSIALATKQSAIVPILVDGIDALRRSDLPTPLAPLADIKPLTLDLDEWDRDVDSFVQLLKTKFSFSSKKKDVKYPKPDPTVAKTNALSWDVLDREVADELPDWRVEFSDDPNQANHKRVEFTRDFEFGSFDKAVKFIDLVAAHAREVDHHPTLVNLWRTVSISLSTWDAGHRITVLDVMFAKYLEKQYRKGGWISSG